MTLKLFNKILQKKITFVFPFTVRLQGAGGQWSVDRAFEMEKCSVDFRSPKGRKLRFVHSPYCIVFDFVTSSQFISYTVDRHNFSLELS